jgi:F0F1-type ATP synthase epsilon subunit
MAVRQDASTGKLVDDGKAAVENKIVDGKPVMVVKIYSPFRVYFDEDAFSISAANATGPFDILPRHHNFMSLLNACEVRIIAPTGEKRIRISGGLMHVQADKVKIFLDV